MRGKVYLVGAGPGDYKLMTLKGMECINKADVIIYDNLINKNYLKSAKSDCEMIFAGKSSNNHTLSQAEINELMVKKAQEEKIVVRLKGGDPYVFGRGGEEVEQLSKYKIPFQVVPGITSAIGGLCYAGIPVTHRDYSSSFHVITGHTRDDKDTVTRINWEALAQLEGTLIFLMGIKNLKQISENLLKYGKSKDTPVAIIRQATQSNQQVYTSTLEEVYNMSIKNNLNPPSLIVVGNVVNLRKKLSFFEHQPLFGQTVVVTRARQQNSEMLEKITDLGGFTVEAPMIKVEKIKNNTSLLEEIKNISKYSFLVFTSTNSVEIFFDTLMELKLDSRALSHLKICVIGTKTAEYLFKRGIQADIVPSVHRLENLLEQLKLILKPTDYLLFPKASKVRPILKNGLYNICSLKEINIYETVVDNNEKSNLLKLLEEKNIDYITFTSSSTVINFVELIGKENLHMLENIKLLSIGPITTKEMDAQNIHPYKEARNATVEDLLEVLIEDSKSSKFGRGE